MFKWTRKQYILNISILLQCTMTINKTNYFLRQGHFTLYLFTSNWSGYGNAYCRKSGKQTWSSYWNSNLGTLEYLAFASQYATEKT